MEAAVYAFRNTINGKVYIGSSRSLRARFMRHLRDLHDGKHHCPALQRAWNLYGHEAFSFGILEHCEPKEMREREAWWMAELRTDYNCMNVRDSVISHGERARHLLSIAGTGRVKSPETCAKLSAALRGVPKSPEHIVNAAAARKGKAYRKGFHLTPETIEKIRVAQRGKKRPNTTETLKKVWKMDLEGNRTRIEMLRAQAQRAANIRWGNI
jgi:group I intron endonuclease